MTAWALALPGLARWSVSVTTVPIGLKTIRTRATPGSSERQCSGVGPCDYDQRSARRASTRATPPVVGLDPVPGAETHAERGRAGIGAGALHQRTHRRAEEPALGRVGVGIVEPLAVMVVAERHGDLQPVTGPGQGHVEQAPFLSQRGHVPGRHIRGEHAVGGVDDMHHVPLPALGRVHGGEHQPVVIEGRAPGQVAGPRRRVEGEVSHELFERRSRRGLLDQPVEVAAPGDGGVVAAHHHRLQPGADPVHLGSGRHRRALRSP